MTNPRIEDEEDKPLDPAVEKVRRKLLRFMVINLGILFIALMAVVGALVYRMSTTRTPAPAAVEAVAPPTADGVLEGTIALPAGARIVSQSLSGRQISLEIEAAGKRSILIYDLSQRQVIGRYAVVAQP